MDIYSIITRVKGLMLRKWYPLRENQGFIDPGLQTGEAMQPALPLDMVHPSGVGFRSFVSIPS
jgi:hypothetical protein